MESATTDVMVNLVFEEQSFHKRVSSFEALAIYATVAAEPESFSDIEIALERYCSAARAAEICQEWRTGLNETTSGPALILDFTARVAGLRAMPFHFEVSELKYDEATNIRCGFSWPGDWYIADTYDQWPAEAEKTRSHRQAIRQLEVRTVLYNVFVEYALNAYQASKDFDVVATHKEWLITPRADLLDKSPRDWLLANYEHIDRDIDAQANIWTLRVEQPPGLDVDSIAYRYALFGRHEFIMYYDMCRVILESLARHPRAVRNALTLDRVMKSRDAWLNDSQDGISPANIIHQERKRLPLTSVGQPTYERTVCGILDEYPISFWRFDDLHMDKDFEFTPCQDREDWELDYEDSFLEDQEEKVGRPPSSIGDFGKNRIWKNSTFNRESMRKLPPHQFVDVLMHGIIFCFAELLQDITENEELSKGLQQLHHDAEKLNDAVRSRSLWTVKSLVASLQSDLSDIRHIAEDLQAKCDDLHCLLSELLAALLALVPQDHENEDTELKA